MNTPPLVGIVGSRRLLASSAPQLTALVQSLAGSGKRIAVGCALGADQLVIAAALDLGIARHLDLFIVAPDWASSPDNIREAITAGAVPHFGAGGPLNIPLRARLARRTGALVRAVQASGPGKGLVCFLPPQGPAKSPGSWLAVGTAAGLSIPVAVFGVPAAALAPLGFGQWQPGPAKHAGMGPWAGACYWRSAIDLADEQYFSVPRPLG